jgi:LmbE family N-acetylglucosaminyl deacetylase
MRHRLLSFNCASPAAAAVDYRASIEAYLYTGAVMLRTAKTSLVATAALILGAVAPVGRAAAGPAAAVSSLDNHPLSMQVVAHADDELLFMNPDVDRSVNSGLPAISVYLTAGELTGDGSTPAERARNRQRGLQNAYAEMTGVADADDATQSEWTGTAFEVAGKMVELYILRSRPDVQLVFLNLPDGQLRNVDTGGSAASVVPAGGLASASSRYTRTDVVGVLRELMTLYTPTVLRSLDPEPDRRSGYAPDHPDHVAAARFAREALTGYPGRLYEINYRAYNISDGPPNLSADETARKGRLLEEYYRYDREFGDSHAGDQWLSRMYYRWPRGTAWVARDARQSMRAFAVSNGAPYVYSQLSSAAWGPAVPLADPGGRLAPGLAAGRAPTGALTVVGHRLTDHHLVALAQAADGSFAPAWSDLGNPNAGSGNEDQVGTPAVAANADGRLQVFVKNAGGGISAQAQTSAGAWSRQWDDLGGFDLQDGVAAVTGPQGRIEIFASSRTEIQHWAQGGTNGPLVRDLSFPSQVPASPPQATVDSRGRISVAYRQPGTGRVMVLEQQPGGGTWASAPVNLGGSGAGRPAVVLTPAGEQLIFARNAADGLSLARRPADGGAAGAWSDLGGALLGEPAAAIDTAGLATVLTIEPAGVSVRRQTGSGPDRPFADQNLGL